MQNKDAKYMFQIKWFMLLPHNQEVPGLNLGSETWYPDRFFMVFLSFSRQMPG
jgi:hypothetical protein